LFGAKILKEIEHSSPKRRSNASLALKFSWLPLFRVHRERKVGERKVAALKIEAPSFGARGSTPGEADQL